MTRFYPFIVIKEADKGSGVILMTKDFYHKIIVKMLLVGPYEEVKIDCSSLVKKVKSFILKYKEKLLKPELDAIIKQEAYLASFYGLPKIHKSKSIQEAVNTQQNDVIECPHPDDLTFRPIVACQNCPTRSLSDLLDKLLRPFVNKVKYRLKDTWHFLRNLPKTALPDEITITADIASLYTNISTERGEAAIRYYCNLYPDLLPARFTIEFLIEIYKFCQSNLYFRYDGKTYRQINGTGMGRIYAPSLADLKQGHDEVQLEIKLHEELPEATANYFLKCYYRYLDDIHMRWRLFWLTLVPTLKQIMNSIDENIQYEFQTSYDDLFNSNPFLDVRITIKNSITHTDICQRN